MSNKAGIAISISVSTNFPHIEFKLQTQPTQSLHMALQEAALAAVAAAALIASAAALAAAVPIAADSGRFRSDAVPHQELTKLHLLHKTLNQPLAMGKMMVQNQEGRKTTTTMGHLETHLRENNQRLTLRGVIVFSVNAGTSTTSFLRRLVIIGGLSWLVIKKNHDN